MVKNLKKKFKKNVLVVGAPFLLFALGLFFGVQSWNKNLYVSWEPVKDRGLAATQDEDSQVILNITSNDLIEDAGPALFNNTQVLEDDNLTFYLGNMLVPNSSTQRHQFICETFSTVEFSFYAQGISLNGEPGFMLVQSPCRTEKLEQIGPFIIPKKEILNNSEKRSFEFPDIDTFVRFYQSSPELTPSWFLNYVRFFNEEGQEFIVKFDPKKHNPVELNWN